jgi:hypothetical protein
LPTTHLTLPPCCKADDDEIVDWFGDTRRARRGGRNVAIVLFVLVDAATMYGMVQVTLHPPPPRCDDPNLSLSTEELKVAYNFKVGRREACEFVINMEALEWWEREGKYKAYEKGLSR